MPSASTFAKYTWQTIPYQGFPHITGYLIGNNITKVFRRNHIHFPLYVTAAKVQRYFHETKRYRKISQNIMGHQVTSNK